MITPHVHTYTLLTITRTPTHATLPSLPPTHCHPSHTYTQLTITRTPTHATPPSHTHTHRHTLACAMALVRVALAAAASLSSVAWFIISCTSLSIESVSTDASCANCSCSAFSSRMIVLRNCWETSEGMRTWRSW